jgi:SagB-type dehydrogenase family enzyme
MSNTTGSTITACLLALNFFTILLVPGCMSESAPINTPTGKPTEAEAGSIVLLPSPDREGSISVEKALETRRSVREYLDSPLSLSDIGQLLWSAQGITDDLRGFRTAPSAGALYPAEVYVVAGNVEGLESGVYRYVPVTHTIIQIKQGDVRALLHDAALRQDSVKNAPACFVITGIYDRTTVRYGERGRMYVHFEIGHIGQNIALQVVALDLGTVVIGAFENDRVRNVLGLPSDEEVFYLMPCGKPVQNPS